jgi:hypothetical protein
MVATLRAAHKHHRLQSHRANFILHGMRIGPTFVALMSGIVISLAAIGQAEPTSRETISIEPDPSRPDSPENKATAAKLDKIIVPNVNFNSLDITAVVDFLNATSKQHDPEHAGVKFRLDLPANANAPAVHRSVSITLSNVPLGELLSFIEMQTNLKRHLVNGVVVWSPPAVPDAP